MSLKDGAKTAIKNCMRVQQEEEVLILTDLGTETVGRALFDAANTVGAEPFFMVMKKRKQHGADLPESVARAMAVTDVVLAPTTKSVTHTQARKKACEAGARVATLPGITEDMMSHGGMTADYGEVKERVEEMAAQVKGAEEAVIESPNGTKLQLDIAGRPWHRDSGICKEPGEMTNLPAGEIYIAPKSAQGCLVVDGAMAGLGLLESPLQFEIEEGQVVTVEGARADELLGIIENAGESGRNVAELGIGLNPSARLIGAMLEDEKVGGTVHVAIGDNSTFGGDVQSEIHLDGIVTDSPRLFIDGEEVELPQD